MTDDQITQELLKTSIFSLYALFEGVGFVVFVDFLEELFILEI